MLLMDEREYSQISYGALPIIFLRNMLICNLYFESTQVYEVIIPCLYYEDGREKSECKSKSHVK